MFGDSPTIGKQSKDINNSAPKFGVFEIRLIKHIRKMKAKFKLILITWVICGLAESGKCQNT